MRPVRLRPRSREANEQVAATVPVEVEEVPT
jgi:hypothetical protein